MPYEKKAASRRRSQAERRAGSERALLKAAVSVVAERGVAAVTFDAIGRKSGLSRGLVTQRFGSKQGLIDAAFSQLLSEQATMLKEEGIPARRGLDAILAFVDASLRRLAARGGGRAYVMLLASAIADARVMRSRFAGAHAGVERQLKGWIVEGQRQGDVRRELDAGAAALMVGGLLLGLSVQALLDPGLKLNRVRGTILAALRLSLAAPSRAARPRRSRR